MMASCVPTGAFWRASCDMRNTSSAARPHMGVYAMEGASGTRRRESLPEAGKKGPDVGSECW